MIKIRLNSTKLVINSNQFKSCTVADPGFPVGGRRVVGGGHQPPMWALFGKNVCRNERTGSCWGGGHQWGPPRSANAVGKCGQEYYFPKVPMLTTAERGTDVRHTPDHYTQNAKKKKNCIIYLHFGCNMSCI